MSTTEERMQILKMIESRQISAEEGARLLAALDKADRAGQAAPQGSPRWFRVRVTDLRTGKSKVNVNIPMGLVSVGIKMGARFAPEVEGLDVEQITKAIREGTQGKIIDVEDEEDAERVEIFIE
ncbi:MAG TPA: hypothetical protein PLJ35_05590 [Anaerolineae bacterium]|nr:hypothetical protein [Anaerolineae bacterium]HOQ98275.1 hypothetical protein [Anaerolineae bacterium]HPL27620.1 hypothetical protein [Anaerolineae bacterium]